MINPITITVTVFCFLFAAGAAIAQQSPPTAVTDPGIDVAASIKQLKNRDKVVLKYDKFKTTQ